MKNEETKAKKPKKKIENKNDSDDQMSDDALKQKIEKIEMQDVDDVLNKEEEINKKIGDIKILNKYAKLAKTMFSMLKDFKNGNYSELPWKSLSAIVFSLLYIFNPFDLVPDFIPGVGYIDDLTVITYAIKFIQNDVHKYLDWKIQDNKTKLSKKKAGTKKADNNQTTGAGLNEAGSESLQPA